MKILVKATSNFGFNKIPNKIIEANSLDEAIERLRTDKELVESVIDKSYSWIDDDLIPDRFIVSILQKDGIDYEIELYDYYKGIKLYINGKHA